MRTRFEIALDRVFPGMGMRPFYLVSAGTWLLVAYLLHGNPSDAPTWFVDGSRTVTGIDSDRFHRMSWSHLAAVVLLLAIPMGLCWVGERWSPGELGFRVRGIRREVAVAGALWAAMVPLIWIAHEAPAFERTYPRVPEVADSAGLFVAYVGLYFFKWVAWEFFFRGFLLFGLERDLGPAAVLVSTMAFTLVHYSKPELEMIGALVSGFVLCAIALRSRSIWPGVLLHWLVASTMDLVSSSWWR